jgi:hypothetical protein
MTTTKITSRGRIALAVSGIVALAATAVGHSVDTAAQATDTAKANAAFAAKANFWQTPVVPSTGCSPSLNLAQDAEISWASAGTPPNGGSYRYYVTIHRDTNPNEMEVIGYVTGTSVKIARDSSRRDKGWYARVYTVNGPKISTGYRAEGFNISSFGLIYSKCSGNKQYVPNQPEPNSSTYAPGITAPASLLAVDDALASQRNDSELPELERVAEPTENGASAASALPPSTTTPATTSTLASPNTSARISATTSTMSASTPPSTVVSTRTTATSTTPRSTTTVTANAATSTATTTQVVPTTSSTVPVASGPVALPGGGEAEIVGGTRLVVSDGSAPVCTATVREGSTLKMRGGVLELTDAGGTHTVDQETCELT